MDDLVGQIAEKLGIDPDQAERVLSQLQSGGHDVAGLIQSGELGEKVQGLLGGDIAGMLGGVPGVGDLLGRLAPQGDDPSV